MLTYLFQYFQYELKDHFFDHNNYEKLSYLDKINLVIRIVFALRNGVLEAEKPFFYNLIEKLAFENDKKISSILTKYIFEIDLETEFLKNLAFHNFYIAKKLLISSTLIDDISLIHICRNNINEVKLVKSLVKRPDISETLTDYIISIKNPNVIKLLLQNFTANVSIDSLVEIIDDYQNDNIIYDNIFKLIIKRPFQLNVFLSKLNNEIKKQILFSICQLYTTKVLYYNWRQPGYSFDFIIDDEYANKLSSNVDQYHLTNTLNELIIIKFLCSGDLYSFIYSISKNTNILYNIVKDIILTNYTSKLFEELLFKAGLSHEMIRASQEMIKILYELCSYEYVDSHNFVNLIKKRFVYMDKNLAVYKTLIFLINLIPEN